jgi:hypothetical protein
MRGKGEMMRQGEDKTREAGGEQDAIALGINMRARQSMVGTSSLQPRYELSFRTRFQGYEDHGPAMFYSSVLSDGPVAFVDKVIIRTPISSLPMREGYKSMFRTQLKDKKYKFYLDPQFRVPGFVVNIGFFADGEHLYITRAAIPLHNSILLDFADCLVGLAWNDLLDLGTLENQRQKAKELLKVFTVSELELRVDLDRRAGSKLIDKLVDYQDEKGRFNLSCYENRHVSGRWVRLYDKSDPVIRVEVILYGKLFADKSLADVLSTPRVTFKRWWPLALWHITQVEKYGHKPNLAYLRRAVAKCVPLAYRVRDLDVEMIANEMIRKGADEGLF